MSTEARRGSPTQAPRGPDQSTHEQVKEYFKKPLEERLNDMTDEQVIGSALEGSAEHMVRATSLRAKRHGILNQQKVEAEALSRIEKQLSDLGIEDETLATDGFHVQASNLLDLDVPAPQPPILDRVADAGATLLFGRGGTGKGSYVAYLILRLIRKTEWQRIILLDFERRAYEWKPRFVALCATPAEMASIIYVTPKSSVPVWDQLDEIRESIGDEPYDLVVVDSAARACAKDISTGDTSLPVRYYGAMDELCSRHLTIAHVNRDNQNRQASGSQRWHDDARLTWSLEEKGDARILTCKKHNGGPKPSAAIIKPTGWSQDALPMITGFSENSYKETLAQMILTVLDQPMTFSDIADALNANNEDDTADFKVDSIKKAVTRDAGLFQRSEGDPGSERYPKWEKVPPRLSKAEAVRAENAR
jgi:hypothetical protein